jgi:hypothetical protein
MTKRRAHVTSAIAILVFAFFYQVTRPAFLNDHFDHLSKARQMLHGEYPVRDFFDPGRPLTVALSAAVLALSHDTLLGEAVLTMGAIAVGVMLVYWLAQRYTGSILWGYWAAACMLAIDLRLYNYPKILVPMVAAWLIVRYLDAPSVARAACLGAWGGLGFLFRHDLGVYLAVATLAALLLRRSRDTARNVAIVGTVAGLVAAPYLIYLQQIDALGSVASEGGEGFLSAARISWLPFVSPFEYSGWRRINAEIWLYYLFLLTPLVAFVLWLTRRITRPLSDHVVALAVLCLALTLFLIRGNVDSRLPDVAAPSFVLAAWTLAALFDAGRTRASHWRWILPAVAVVVAAVTVVSVQELVEWQSGRRITRAIARLPTSISEPIAYLGSEPLVAWENDRGRTGLRGLARWMRSCTGVDDRFLVVGYFPELFFYARRLFAGGMLFFQSGYFSRPADQQLTVERLRRQSTPFVVVEDGGMAALDGMYATVGAYIHENYQRVAESGFGDSRTFVILQAKKAASYVGADGLPCLAGV